VGDHRSTAAVNAICQASAAEKNVPLPIISWNIFFIIVLITKKNLYSIGLGLFTIIERLI
jgi:hypothetical protein